MGESENIRVYRRLIGGLSDGRLEVLDELTDADDLAATHLGHTDHVDSAVGAALAAAGSEAKLCVLPHGPLTVPYLL